MLLLATEIILFMTVIGNGVLLMLLLKERRSLSQGIFGIYVAAIAGWAFAILLNLWLQSPFVEMWIFAFAAIILTSQFWFAKLFPDDTLPMHAYEYWSLAIGVFFTVASFVPDAVFTSLSVHPEGYTTLANGFLSVAYSVFALIFVVAPIGLVYKKSRAVQDPMIRTQLEYLTLGFFLFAAVNVLTNSILPVFFKIFFFNAIGPVFSLLLAALIFYIIHRHQFLNIRAAVQRGVVYSLLLGMIVAAYVGLLFVVEQVFSVATSLAAPISASAVLIIGIFTAPTIEHFFRKATDHLFFKDRYEYSEALQRLSDILASELTPNDLMTHGLHAVKDTLRLDRIEFFHARSDMIITPSGVTHEQSIEAPEAEIPVMLQNKTLGTLRLGRKRSGDLLSREDVALVRTFASQAAVALQKAELYQELKNHSALLEEKVRERTIHLEAMQQNQRVIFEEISHALQTPLAVLKGAIEILVKKETGEKERESQLRTVAHGVDNLSHVTSELLKLAKTDAPSRQHPYDDVDLSRVVESVLEYIGIICREHQIELSPVIEKDIRMIGDEKRLEELVTNLLSNAVRYTRESPSRSINVSLRRESGMVVLEVRDTGIGIRAEDMPHIFERFYRSEAVKSTSGIGLGLSICKKIAEQHGGTIEVESTEGKGATFTARFPRGVGQTTSQR